MIKRLLKRTVLVLTCLILLLAGFVVFSVRRSFPQTTGDVHIASLTGSVEIIRDQFGVPHIYAQNRDDLFRAQGYVHAQDRFWQMDFWRHTGKGQLSELFGKTQIETDKFLRMMAWAKTSETEIDQLDPISVSILNAYCEGVNAYLAEHSGSKLSLEHGILGLTNREYKPERWTPLDSMVWGKVMSWDLGENLYTETYRARLLNYLPQQKVDQLFPPYPADNPFILPGFKTLHARRDELRPYQLAKIFDSLPLNHDSEEGIGSNNWVISGKRTRSGKPLLANDPHLSAQMPSIWYQVHLQCVPQSENCRFNAAGFSFAGVPGIILGHNDRIAWGMTNVGPDVMDLYIEKINPANANQYEVNGKWLDMRLQKENIQVANDSPVAVTLRYTRHGPVLSDFSKNTKDIKRTRISQLPQNYAISLRWTALSPMTTFPAIWKMNLARNWEEFRTAASNFDVPSQNLIYADIDGNIGYQCPGKIPVRAKGDGTYPVPGWTDEYEWKGYIPFDDLPLSYNPAAGYVASANNAVISNDYLTSDWDYGWRAKRIVEMIESRKNPIDIDFIQKMQGDNKNLNAQNILPVLLTVDLQNEHLKMVRNLFNGWDHQLSMDSAPAALFEVFWKNLIRDTFYDEIPATLHPGGGSRWMEVMRHLLQNPDDPWWDNHKTNTVEHRDDILRAAFSEAVQELERTQENDISKWKWGNLHTLTFRNETFGHSGIDLIEKMFNRGPFATGGGTVTVNATSWDISGSYEVTALPSMRMIVDLSDLNGSLAIHTTGQSGHSFNRHYIDMPESWRKIQYHPMLWDRSRVETNAEAKMRLIP